MSLSCPTNMCELDIHIEDKAHTFELELDQCVLVGSNALKIMKDIIHVGHKPYASASNDEFVYSIGHHDAPQGECWVLFIDNVKSTKAINQVDVKAQMKITWELLDEKDALKP